MADMSPAIESATSLAKEPVEVAEPLTFPLTSNPCRKLPEIYEPSPLEAVTLTASCPEALRIPVG